MDGLRTLDEIVTGDLDGAFLHTASNRCAWAYSTLFDSVQSDPLIPDRQRDEEFGRRRSAAVTAALVEAAEVHGVPFDLQRLSANGQRKLVLRAGRITLIHEPIQQMFSAPAIADYKVEMSRCQGILQQLELDLGDLPSRMIDFSGSILGVLLHGAAGTRFNREGRALGAFMLGIPTSGYTAWARRFDLSNLALFGFGNDVVPRQAEPDEIVHQADQVHVRARVRSRSAKEASK